MEVKFLMKLCGYFTYLHLSEAAWALTGSSNVGVVGEQFTLTCTPDRSNNIDTIQWRRNNAVVANIESSNCAPDQNVDTLYTYTCSSGPVFHLTIPVSSMTSDQHNTVWRCNEPIFGGTAEYTLIVNTPVSSITIKQLDTGYPDVPVVYENKAKIFECVTNGCNPRATVTVAINGVNNQQINGETYSTANGLSVTSRTFTVTAARGDHGKTITCTAVNIQGRQPVTQTMTLDVYYTPTITLDTTAILVEEGSSVNRVCSAAGNPTPVINWYRGDTQLTPGTAASASLTYSNIDRGITGIYTCRAISVNAPYKVLQSEASVSITVQYPPTAQVPLKSVATEHDSNVEIICDITNGVPATNTFHGWSQSIGGTVIRSGLSGTADGNNNKLVFPPVTFGDTGEYKCEVGNGIKGRQPSVIQSASANFSIRASAKFNSNDRRKAAEQNKDTTLSFPFYSNPPALVNNIKWTNESNVAVLTSSSSISFDLVNAKVEKQIRGKTVSLDGQIVSIAFKPFLSYHVGNYTIDVTNGGTLISSFSFQIGASAPPDKPFIFDLMDRTANSVTLTWTAGFNGGHPQTFVLRYSTSNIFTEKTIGEKQSQSNYTYKVDELNPSTKYLFWLYSKNIKGNSSLVSETPLEAETSEVARSAPSSNAGTVTGGVMGTFIVIAIVAIVIGVMFYRRRHTTDTCKSSDSKEKSTHEYADLQTSSGGNPYDRCNVLSNTNVYENQGLTGTQNKSEPERTIGDNSTYEDVGRKGDAKYDDSPSQENKYEDLRRSPERSTYEGINLSDDGHADKVYYVNTELRS